jgi:hypothetical protein
MLEYLALGVLAAVILAGLVTAGLSDTFGGGVHSVVCRVVGESGCATRPPVAGGDRENGPSPAPSPSPPSDGPTQPRATPHPSDNPSPTPDPGIEARKRTEAALNETPTGRAILAWAKAHGVRMVYRKQEGDYYTDGDNTIYLDYRESPEDLAATLAHEMNHARTRDYPPVDTMSRAEYIDKSIQEEAHGNVLQVKENQALQRVRGPGKVPDTLLQSEYEAAYDTAVSNAQAAATRQGRTLSPQEKQRIGEQAGEAREKKAIEDGEIVQSDDGKFYRDHYGKQWDDAHKKSCVLFVCW